MNEQDKAQLILGAMELRRSQWVQHARHQAYLHARDAGTVSVVDMREQLQLPDGADPALWGAVFRDKRFEAVGFTTAQHKGSHGRAVRLYRIRSE